MITVSTTTSDALNKSVNVSLTSGCTLEYNMNALISGAAITAPEGILTATLTAPPEQGGYTYKPFEKLFPITSIIDPRRPKKSGIQYMILGDPSLSSTLGGGTGSAETYASSIELNKRLYFSSPKTAYKYWVAKATGNALTNCVLTVSYPAVKTAATNKIVIKFETSHSKPTAWTVNLTNLSGVDSLIYTGTTCPDSGVVELYYNGTSWTTTQPATVPQGINLSGLKLGVTSISASEGYLGIIEISARLLKDVTDILESFNISQNSSDSINGLVPVGNVSANSLRISLNSYDRSYENYDKVDSFNKDKLNLYSNVMVRPYTVVESEKINLGVFYIDSYEVDEFGEVSINALDGARELQYIRPPDIVCKDMSSVAIIRRMLDSIGFTNYKFNLSSNDKSIISPFYWFTDPQKTVWQHIQDLCKDTQMVAVFDNTDTLQFYPRGYIFDIAKTPQASFRYDTTSDGKLSNISSIAIENVPSVKAIKVTYRPQITSNYDGDGDNLYTSPVVTLGAAALMKDLPAVAPAEGVLGSDLYAPKGVVTLEAVQISGAATTFYSYTGYLVLGKEIIEYDAIKYQYVPLAGGVAEKWISSASDIQANQALSKPGTFKPIGQYRIKERNAFGVVLSTDTASLTHSSDTSALQAEWTGSKWDSGEGTFVTPSNAVFTLKQTDVVKDSTGKDVNNEYNLVNSIPKSMMTIFAPPVKSEPSPTDNTLIKYTENKIYSMATTNAKYFTSSGQVAENFILGTSMYFPLIKKEGNATGDQKTISGLAFSLSANNQSGYYLSIATSQNTKAEKSFREINLYKIVNGKPVKMSDSQRDTDGTIITNISGGRLYRADIRANYSTPAGGSSKVLSLKISINNKTFAVIDENPIPITEKIGLISLQGVSAFDYVYSSIIDSQSFLVDSAFDPYKGFLGGESAIVKTFGDFIFNQKTQTASDVWIREFGPVARELRRIKSRYESPGFPLYPELVNNPDVTIVGSDIDSFSADMYVLNNTGAFTDLANSEEKQFIVVGNSIESADSFEYIDPDISEADKQEQVGFDSIWIQKESEAKELAKWMTGQWSKQQKVLSLGTFINPIIQIGDVIQVSYPNNKIYSTEDASIPSGYVASKFVVLSIDSTYDKDSPPTTTIVCRSIYT
jgi:hypothetical protein